MLKSKQGIKLVIKVEHPYHNWIIDQRIFVQVIIWITVQLSNHERSDQVLKRTPSYTCIMLSLMPKLNKEHVQAKKI